MGKLALKQGQMLQALERLDESIFDLQKLETFTEKQLAIIEELNIFEEKREFRSKRDSVIQRFELCTDLFWKYLKRYLTEKMQITLEAVGPTGIIRTAHQTKLLTEEDTEKLLQMIKDRNHSSHIYKEKKADEIVDNVPTYYKLMKKYIDKLTPLG